MKKIIITGGLGYIGTELCKLYSGEARFKDITDQLPGEAEPNQKSNLLTQFIMHYLLLKLGDKSSMKEISRADLSKAGIEDDRVATYISKVQKNKQLAEFINTLDRTDFNRLVQAINTYTQDLSITISPSLTISPST